ncbi:transcriptional regulator, GntR family [Devosia sp. YR412]|uniref:GntR family transcriptional regulator n=1 Tax=Devosia sp. YR412 TaxID=1881030 RepID=UPI0008BF5BE5|nr:GntR family transcriptional regulator [Devosia sp. YR412]SEQ10532.1 transcriptional regulator, GntR family [Devosia sp. YR412]
MRASALVLEIADQIRLRIASEELPAGSHLNALMLGAGLGVSRSPVQAALHILSEQGLVRQKRNRGFFVAENGDPHVEIVPEEPETYGGTNSYQRMADDWLTDRLQADVGEKMLRDRYELTKAQVTSALMRASREGWAERKRGKGWTLLPVAKTPQAFEQIYRYRLLVEPAAMLEPTFERDLKVIDQQRRLQHWMLEADLKRVPVERLLQNGAQFHEELARISGNPFFYQTIQRLNRMRRLLEYRTPVDRARLERQCLDHLHILDLLQRRENEEASRAMSDHLRGSLSQRVPAMQAWADGAVL